MNNDRVVVTGTGIVSCVGMSVEETWAALLAGRSGIGPVTHFDVTDFRTQFAGEIDGFEPADFMPVKDARRLDRYCQLAVVAAQQAVAQSGLDMTQTDGERVGVFVGSGIGGIRTFEEQCRRQVAGGPGRVSPFLIPMLIADMASGVIAINLGAGGPNFSVVSACATGAHCLGEAYRVLQRGDADVMVAGGAEAPIGAMGMAGFSNMKALSERNDDPTRASRPFDANRDGFVMAEGAGVIILERLAHAQQRGATILGEIIGYAATADAYHMTAPAPNGQGASRAIAKALADAGIGTEDVDYINAHGTSTPLNDKFETMAIKHVFGERAAAVPISSTKALTGHTLGAAGGIESIVCLKAIQEGRVPGTHNYETPDPDCDLDYVVNSTREHDVKVALNLNFGFGGHNAVLVLKRYQA